MIHTTRVALSVEKYYDVYKTHVEGICVQGTATPKWTLMIVAILHDTLEDTDATTAEIEHNFGVVVSDRVQQSTLGRR